MAAVTPLAQIEQSHPSPVPYSQLGRGEWLDAQLLKLTREGRIRLTSKGYVLPAKPDRDDDAFVASVKRKTREEKLKLRQERLSERKVIWCKGCGKRRYAINFAKVERKWPRPLCYSCKWKAKRDNEAGRRMGAETRRAGKGLDGGPVPAFVEGRELGER